jgi:hypothetical protein
VGGRIEFANFLAKPTVHGQRERKKFIPTANSCAVEQLVNKSYCLSAYPNNGKAVYGVIAGDKFQLNAAT